MSEIRRKESGKNKVKILRNDLFREAVAIYLKRKKFVGLKLRSSEKLQNCNQFVFSKMVEVDLARANSFLYSSIICGAKNYALIEQQFVKFVNFVQSQEAPIKAELSNLFGPILCHIYLDLLKSKESKLASDLLRKYAYLIAPVQDNTDSPLPNKINGCSINTNSYDDSLIPTGSTQIVFTNESTGDTVKDHFKEIIQILSCCTQIEAVECINIIAIFRSSKYDINLSLESLDALKKYLHTNGHIIILSIFKTWIHFVVADLQDEVEINFLKYNLNERQLQENCNDTMIDINGKIDLKNEYIENVQYETTANDSNVLLRKLKNSVMKLNRFESPTRLYKISDSDNKLTCASLNESNLIAGFKNSAIKLWPLDKERYCSNNIFNLPGRKYCDSFKSSDSIEIEEEDFSASLEREKTYHKSFIKNSNTPMNNITLRGHSEGVTDIKFSSHYPLIFSVSKDSTMRTWKLSNNTCAAVYRGHNYPIWCVNESPIERYLATGSRDLTARLWSIDREFPLITYVGHTQDVNCVAFHPNGNYLATGSSDLSVRLWSVTNGKLLRLFTECKFPITCLAFSPDGKSLAVAGEETKIRVFDLAASSIISEYKDHNSPINSIAWNTSGDKLVSSCRDGSVRIWDATKTIDKNSSSNQVLWHMVCGDGRLINASFNSTDILACVLTI